MEKLRPLRDNVIVVNFERGERTSSGGIIIADDNGKEHGIRARWAEVYAVGPEQKDVKVVTGFLCNTEGGHMGKT